MSGPQLEDGYTRIAHEILDEISRFTFNGAQFRIIIKVWRQTYGYNRKDHELSLTFLQEATGLSESAVRKEVTALINAKVLLVTQEAKNNSSRKLAFNKNYEQWTIRKSGDSVKQQDLFDYTEGHDCSTRRQGLKGHDCSTPECHDCSTRSNDFPYFEGHDCSTKKEISSLKKSIKENVGVFEQFFVAYPRKVSKQAAIKAWNKLRKDPSFNPDRVIEQTHNFAETCRLLETMTRFIPHPSTFLNQKRYEDYPVVDPEGLAAQKKLTAFEKNNMLLNGKMREDEGGDERRDDQNIIDIFRSLSDGRAE